MTHPPINIPSPTLTPWRHRARRATPWLCWVAAFLVAWLLLITLGHHWTAVEHHWPIALAMALGSYVAGSTPMGGGTIGFPVLTLILDEPARLGRDFSFAIQSVGMTSASILIFCMRQHLARRMLVFALLGTTVGTPLGVAILAPHTPELAIKLVFAILWASFGIMHLVKMREICSLHGRTGASRRFDATAGLLVGFVGGTTVAAITGVGVDMLLYVVLVLLTRCDLKAAIPSSVILMAWTSLMGMGARLTLAALGDDSYALPDELLYYWLAAAPIVLFGAPLGAVVVRLMPREPTLIFVSVLCVGQFVWTIYREWHNLTALELGAAIIAVCALNLAFITLHHIGRRFVASRRPDMHGP
ncbi:MAG: sulfite exporter TauE/SafE family protein [Phycisphaerales bacterium]|nr:sulfite exporter TauE/SafE family protein [Phycisphaerales bacterium]